MQINEYNITEHGDTYIAHNKVDGVLIVPKDQVQKIHFWQYNHYGTKGYITYETTEGIFTSQFTDIILIKYELE